MIINLFLRFSLQTYVLNIFYPYYTPVTSYYGIYNPLIDSSQLYPPHNQVETFDNSHGNLPHDFRMIYQEESAYYYSNEINLSSNNEHNNPNYTFSHEFNDQTHFINQACIPISQYQHANSILHDTRNLGHIGFNETHNNGNIDENRNRFFIYKDQRISIDNLIYNHNVFQHNALFFSREENILLLKKFKNYFVTNVNNPFDFNSNKNKKIFFYFLPHPEKYKNNRTIVFTAKKSIFKNFIYKYLCEFIELSDEEKKVMEIFSEEISNSFKNKFEAFALSVIIKWNIKGYKANPLSSLEKITKNICMITKNTILGDPDHRQSIKESIGFWNQQNSFSATTFLEINRFLGKMLLKLSICGNGDYQGTNNYIKKFKFHVKNSIDCLIWARIIYFGNFTN